MEKTNTSELNYNQFFGEICILDLKVDILNIDFGPGPSADKNLCHSWDFVSPLSFGYTPSN